jgi:hypothetical protein
VAPAAKKPTQDGGRHLLSRFFFFFPEKKKEKIILNLSLKYFYFPSVLDCRWEI